MDYLRSAWHNWFPSIEFSENTARTPQVNSNAIVCCAEEKLRRPIPESDHTAGQRMALIRVKEVCKPEVSNFQDSIIVDEEIRTLDVPVQDISGMAVI